MSTDRYIPQVGDWVIAQSCADRRYGNIDVTITATGQVECVDSVDETARVYIPELPVPINTDAETRARLLHPWMRWRDLKNADQRGAVIAAETIIQKRYADTAPRSRGVQSSTSQRAALPDAGRCIYPPRAEQPGFIRRLLNRLF